MPQLPLSGQKLLVTRPAGQGGQLLAGIRALGGEAHHIPFLDIQPVQDLAPLQAIAHRLGSYHACVFISANAVEAAWSTLVPSAENGWPESVVAAAVGPGTAKVLRARGVPSVILPSQQFDSEGLLAEATFAPSACRGQSVALIRGEGGRDFLAQTLRARGARVDEAAVYRRALHLDALAALQAWVGQCVAGQGLLVISSSESLQRVISAASPGLSAALQAYPMLVPHERIAAAARQLGFQQIHVCAGGDEGILNYLQTYNALNRA